MPADDGHPATRTEFASFRMTGDGHPILEPPPGKTHKKEND